MRTQQQQDLLEGLALAIGWSRGYQVYEIVQEYPIDDERNEDMADALVDLLGVDDALIAMEIIADNTGMEG